MSLEFVSKYYGRQEGIGDRGEQYWPGDGYVKLIGAVLSTLVYVWGFP